ncbi:MAG: hypothetical protein JXR96_01385 [Deltaproteobacteria bacterium]|nr:hypothetical protein [Deltaproteobacteria bacterium]
MAGKPRDGLSRLIRNEAKKPARSVEPIEEAVIKTLSSSRQTGLLFDELVDDVARQVNPLDFPLRKTVSYYTRLVQHDLERRGVIERVPGVSPIRLRLPGKKR